MIPILSNYMLQSMKFVVEDNQGIALTVTHISINITVSWFWSGVESVVRQA